MNKIKDYRPQDQAELLLRFTDIQIKKTQANAEYASLLGFDGTDLIEVKIWSLPEEKKEKLSNGEIYLARGTMKDYQGKMQFNVSDFSLAEETEEVNFEAFYEKAKLSKEELQSLIKSYINKIENPIIRGIVVSLMKENFEKYFLHPAATGIHHNYYSGLAYHVYSMLTLSDGYLRLYPYLNKDLVYAGIIIHDIGKLVELSGPKGTEYTKEGNLLGHITIGCNMLYKACLDLKVNNTDEALALQHIIISHHGHLEYGSPKEPLMGEAFLVYILDFSDSRFASLEKVVSGSEKGTYTDNLIAFDRKKFYIPDVK